MYQRIRRDFFAQKLNEIDSELTKFDYLGKAINMQDPIPKEDPILSMPPIISEKHATSAPLFPLNNNSSPILVSSSTLILPSRNITNIPKLNEASPRVTKSPLVTKWTHLPCIESGKQENLNIPAGSKRSSELGSNHLELPKKKKLVSKDGKENSMLLAAVGSQPRLDK